MLKKKHRSLRFATFTIIGASVGVFLLVFFLMFWFLTSRRLTAYETEQIISQFNVAEGMIESRGMNMNSIAREWASDSYMLDFAKGEYAGFIDEVLNRAEILRNNQFNFIIIKDSLGDDLYSAYHKSESEEDNLPEGFSESLNELSKIVSDSYINNIREIQRLDGRSGNAEIGKTGFFLYGGQMYQISVMPITDGEKRPAGTLYIGKAIDSNYLESVAVLGLNNFSLIEGKVCVFNSNAESVNEYIVERFDRYNISVTSKMNDLYGNEVFFRLEFSRDSFNNGLNLMIMAMFLFLFAVFMLIVMLYMIIGRFFIKPSEELSRTLKNTDAAGAINAGKLSSNTTEFFVLCESINDLTLRLENSIKAAEQSNLSLSILVSILDGMNAFVYVSDIETDEILFINNATKEHFNLEGKVEGRLCWEVLQEGYSERCPFCPIHELNRNPDKPIVWREHNTVTKRFYRNTDSFIQWPDGRTVHLQHSVDITDIKIAQDSLDRRLKQEELMSVISQSFLKEGNISDIINNALTLTGEFSGVNKIIIGKFNYEKNSMEYEYTWNNQEKRIFNDDMKEWMPDKEYLTYTAFSDEGKGYIAIEDTSVDSTYEVFRKLGVDALLSVPLTIFGSLWGNITFLCYDGAFIWTESDVQLIKHLASIIMSALDRAKTEKELYRMSSVVNTSPQFIITLDITNMKFDYINQGAVAMSGYSRQALVEENLSMLFDDSIRTWLVNEIIPKVLKEGKLSFDVPMIRKDNKQLYLTFTAFAINKERTSFAAIGTNTTEKKRLEMELVEAKEVAEQSSRAKGDFLSRMSHEMRTPMNAIIGMTNIARSSNDISKKEYCLEKINDASTHLLGVINDILDMSKIEANKFELSDSDFSFEKMLLRVINVMNFKIEEKNQNLVIKIDKNVPDAIVADEQRLAQVITNILSNAVKFTPEHGKIIFSAKKLGEENDFSIIEISIKDTGIGISPEQQKKLFRSFEQADGGISRKFGGTGLGLAITKSIVEMMQGNVGIHSDEGKGADFYFTIKVKESQIMRRKSLDIAIKKETLRVLFIDSSQEMQEHFKNISEILGFTCDTCVDAREALSLVSKYKYDFVFTDWSLDGIKGTEFIQKLRSAGNHVIVVTVSTSIWSEIESYAREAGADKFIPKPLLSCQIAECINDYIIDSQNSEDDVFSSEGIMMNFKDKHILLAEDVDINREIVVAVLGDTEVKIDEAENGMVACQMFEEGFEKYDLIFMDIHMPIMDGYEAAKTIRDSGLPNSKTIPIVAMTANVFREDIEKCMEAGMNEHIGKPVDFQEIMTVMEKYLK